MKDLDSAIVSLLKLDPSGTEVRPSGGGSSSAKTFHISSNGAQYFVKTASGQAGEIMLAGEHAGLNALANAVPHLAPQSYGCGRLADSSGSFLVTDFIDMSRLGGTEGDSLATKLAKLHTTSAPIPQGHDSPQFGFPVPTCCGDTQQPNGYKNSWAEFFAINRMRFIKEESLKNQGKDAELAEVVEQICENIVPRLLGELKISPVVVHGDLWSGNTNTGRLPGMSKTGELVYDPSACYAHSEFDLGIMHMFGGFNQTFFSAYHKLCPKTDPVGEYDDRVALYESYHHLNHYAMFGGGYRTSGLRILRTLLKKYSGTVDTTD